MRVFVPGATEAIEKLRPRLVAAGNEVVGS